MNEVNPIIIFLMFIGRCLVPLFLMLGISYVLHRLGLIKEPPVPPPPWRENGGNSFSSGGEIAHDPS
jgi:hypothetical protein